MTNLTGTETVTQHPEAEVQVKIYLSQLYEMEATVTNKRNALQSELEAIQAEINKYNQQREELISRFEGLVESTGKAQGGKQKAFDDYLVQLNAENPTLADRVRRVWDGAAHAVSDAWDQVRTSSEQAWQNISTRITNLSKQVRTKVDEYGSNNSDKS